MKTEAAVLKSLTQPLELYELEIPPLRRGQVLVKIAYSGVCRSQLNEIKGFKGADHYLPHTLGHEGSGIVLEIGVGVTKVKPGDHVVLSWIKGDGIDAGGCQYDSDHGIVNSGPISTFLSVAVISENRLVPIPQELDLREAALLGCAVPTGAGIVFNQLKIQPGSSCGVFGVGGIGMSALVAAKYLQAQTIVAIDVSDSKLAFAQTLGATHLINSTKTDPLVEIKKLTENKGLDYVLECAGKREAMESAFSATKTGGGLCVIAGNLPQNTKIEIDPFALIAGKHIIGSWGGGSTIDRDVALYSELILDKKISFKPLITHEVGLDSLNSLLIQLEQGNIGRGLINITKDAEICQHQHF